MKLWQRAIAGMTMLVVLSFAALLGASVLWPPQGDTFRIYVAKEAATVALQLIGITLVGALVSELVRGARDRSDFARRVRRAYGKAKMRRRRLRQLPAEERPRELEVLDEVQLEFEDLRDEAKRTFGKGSQVVANLTSIEKYLHDVVDAGLANGANAATSGNNFQDFVSRHSGTSRFATDFKKAYHSIEESLG